MCGQVRGGPSRWPDIKLQNLRYEPPAPLLAALGRVPAHGSAALSETLFENPFRPENLLALDDATLRGFVGGEIGHLAPQDIAHALRASPSALVGRLMRLAPPAERTHLAVALYLSAPASAVEAARSRMLDALFWELTYWTTPDLYEDLTAAERLHPGIFQRLGPAIRGRSVLDAGAGSGRATLECLRHGARRIYAVEPSPGLLRILERKLADGPNGSRVILLPGRFDALPLPDDAVEVALACSAFTADASQGGERGLAELTRVTRRGGRIVLIWPRPQDYAWLAARDFRYVALPVHPAMGVRYRSLESALHVARRFYARTGAAQERLLESRQPVLPYTLLGINPPHDYCWRPVDK